MQLHNLKSTPGARNHKRKIVGRGHGSGMGKTSGRGQDGQKSRKSGHTRLAFEGGQTPLYRRVQKVGFNNYEFANNYHVINLKEIAVLKEKIIDLKLLVSLGYFSKHKNWPLKVIGNTNIGANITIKANKFSAGALKAIEASNSKAEMIEEISKTKTITKKKSAVTKPTTKTKTASTKPVSKTKIIKNKSKKD